MIKVIREVLGNPKKKEIVLDPTDRLWLLNHTNYKVAQKLLNCKIWNTDIKFAFQLYSVFSNLIQLRKMSSTRCSRHSALIIQGEACSERKWGYNFADLLKHDNITKSLSDHSVSLLISSLPGLQLFTSVTMSSGVFKLKNPVDAIMLINWWVQLYWIILIEDVKFFPPTKPS